MKLETPAPSFASGLAFFNPPRKNSVDLTQELWRGQRASVGQVRPGVADFVDGELGDDRGAGPVDIGVYRLLDAIAIHVELKLFPQIDGPARSRLMLRFRQLIIVIVRIKPSLGRFGSLLTFL